MRPRGRAAADTALRGIRYAFQHIILENPGEGGQVMRSPISSPVRHHDGGHSRLSAFGSQDDDLHCDWPVSRPSLSYAGDPHKSDRHASRAASS